MQGFLEAAAAGLVLGLASGVSPGPLLTLVVGESLRHGARAGSLVALAPLVTDAPVVILFLWLARRFHDTDTFVGTVSFAGALFLVWLGVEGLRVKPPDATAAAERARPLQKGIVTNLLNPNLYVFWATVGAAVLAEAFTDGWPAALAFLALFYACLIGSKALIALLVARSRHILGKPGYVWANRVLGVALLVFAALFVRQGVLAFAG